MRNKLSSVVFAQGWIESQLENMVSNAASKQDEEPTAHLVMSQVQEQWVIISNALDELIRENQELERRLMAVKIALS